jgi:hypothetical protein
MEIAPYMLPAGGNQLKKSIQGLKMFSDDHPVTGSYTDSGSLRFPVEATPLNVAQAAIFGQYASKNAREYFDNDYAPLSEKQIQEYVDVDMPIKDYWEYREGLKALAPLPGNKGVTLEQQADYIDSLDLPAYKKSILINNIADRKTPIDMTSYGEYDSFDEFDFATKNPGKYKVAEIVGGYDSYKAFDDAIGDIDGKDANGKSVSGLKKDRIEAYIGSLNLSAGQKAVLFRFYYPKDDRFSSQAIAYINSLSHLSYNEKVEALTALGFKVAADGQIYDMD